MTTFEFLMQFADQHPFLSFCAICAICAVGSLGRIASTRNETKVKVNPKD